MLKVPRYLLTARLRNATRDVYPKSRSSLTRAGFQLEKKKKEKKKERIEIIKQEAFKLVKGIKKIPTQRVRSSKKNPVS